MITENRLHHILGVARKAYTIAKNLSYNEDFCRRCFALGWNHDIGYEFDINNHAEVGANIVKIYDTNNAIRNHGSIPDTVNLEWLILNLADMTTSPTGEEVSMTIRLEDIKKRYGANDDCYISSKKVCDILTNKFDKIFLRRFNYV